VFRAGIFDLDGTLVDTVDLHARSWVAASRALGLRVDEGLVKSLMGLRAIDIARTLGGGEELLVLKNRIYMELLDHVKPMPGAHEVLSGLKSMGLGVGVVTSSSRVVAEATLRHVGLMDHVDVLVAGDDVDEGKPSPRPVIRALEMLRLGPRDVFVVGDTVYDVEMALRAGVGLVFILSREGIDGAVVIGDLREIMVWIVKR
jgi:phosphoglycolate phosphatase